MVQAVERREVPIDEIEPLSANTADAEEQVLAGERKRVSERVSSMMSVIISNLPADERLILQLRFEGGMTVAEIARAMQIEQKLLYRRIERRMHEIRAELERAGIASRDVLDLIGRDDALVSFDLGKQESRPSIPGDEKTTARSEVPQ